MVDVLGRRLLADRAQTTLLGKQLIEVLRGNPVSAPQMVIPRAAILSLSRRPIAS
ncbi:MAG TPA: hypothetical protein VE442_22140 [Jatrophihabitans sp.]|nr:hypothetical protein [Jatrophihabitans sp.]